VVTPSNEHPRSHRPVSHASLEYAATTAEVAAKLEDGVARAVANADMPPESVAALHDSGLMRMRVPSCLGGGEVDARTAFATVEKLSYVDGATGWTFMAGANLLSLAGAYLGDDAVAEIFADPHACIAGQVAPRGMAERTDGGYRVGGDFGFGSGAAHSSYMMGGFRELSGGQPVRLDKGLPNVLVGVVPRRGVEFLGNWDVLGLQGTGSVDYRVVEQEIAAGWTWPLFTGKPLRGGPFYRMGIFGITAIDHAGFSIGVARRALDDIAALATTKKRQGRAMLVDDQIFLYEYAQCEARRCAARAFFLEAITDLERAATTDSIGLGQRAKVRLSATNAARSAIDVTAVAYRYSGSTGLRNGSAIQQCLRDLTAAEAHVFTDHNTWRDAAVALLGVAPSTLFL
jgi:alkylation response protein AidB-like acyl-CoA dehydrogenase